MIISAYLWTLVLHYCFTYYYVRWFPTDPCFIVSKPDHIKLKLGRNIMIISAYLCTLALRYHSTHYYVSWFPDDPCFIVIKPNHIKHPCFIVIKPDHVKLKLGRNKMIISAYLCTLALHYHSTYYYVSWFPADPCFIVIKPNHIKQNLGQEYNDHKCVLMHTSASLSLDLLLCKPVSYSSPTPSGECATLVPVVTHSVDHTWGSLHLRFFHCDSNSLTTSFC